jgi:hypothetical protein
MKKIFLLFILLVSAVNYAQTNGITYQAVILKPGGEQLPGYNNLRAPLINTKICLRFKFLNAASQLEYQEDRVVVTDEFGMVNLVLGNGPKTGGFTANYNAIVWNGSGKNLVVELDEKGNCTSFTQISNQPFTSVPYALFAANSGTPGTPGPQGPQGPQGPAGPTGATGAMGPQGPAGPMGTTGTMGPQGPAGPTGATGLTGPQGVAGPSGPQGPTGATGADGAQGAAGPSGPQGPAGPQGVAGPTGAIGPQGPTGLTGPQGTFQNGNNNGDMLFWNGNSWNIIPIGAENSILKVINGIPSWGANTNLTPPSNLQVGDYWGGGIVFYIAQPGDSLLYVPGEIHGLIVTDFWETFAKHSCNLDPNTWGFVPDNTSTLIGTGLSNSNQIILNNTFPNYDCPAKRMAARICRELNLNGYTDWFLPSRDELLKLYQNKNVLNNYHPTSSVYYLSSTRELTSLMNALTIQFTSGQVFPLNKTSFEGAVRPIRKF